MTAASGFPMPQSIEIEQSTATDTYARFTAAPFQSGFGHTLGNSLRRVLLSSLEGAAISAVRINGASHEFTSLPHVLEDVTEIILNLKRIHLVAHGDVPKTLEIKKNKAGVVSAADIITDGTIEILNPEQVICTLDKDTAFRAELEITKGRGYCPAEKNKRPDHPLGTIPVDCLFSPVTLVRYHVGAARLGEETEMDSLCLEIWTDGRITPKDALERASKILKDHLRPFLGSQAGEDDALASISDEEQKLYKVLIQDVEVLDLSVRAMNCLNNANIKLIGELCAKTETRMLKYRNFGKKSLDEIKNKLCGLNLSLGMVLSEEMVAAIQGEADRIKTAEQQKEEKK
ncbi:MAG: DNA-directed RNA polymerase subunit alpha [Lentisphaerae bacterium GWF2_52_8]|nr:MAG: DNA-directed RNA polymerase subunit alpha [Lentisphaerae bacterium GWF2_52_8]